MRNCYTNQFPRIHKRKSTPREEKVSVLHSHDNQVVDYPSLNRFKSLGAWLSEKKSFVVHRSQNI